MIFVDQIWTELYFFSIIEQICEIIHYKIVYVTPHFYFLNQCLLKDILKTVKIPNTSYTDRKKLRYEPWIAEAPTGTAVQKTFLIKYRKTAPSRHTIKFRNYLYPSRKSDSHRREMVWQDSMKSGKADQTDPWIRPETIGTIGWSRRRGTSNSCVAFSAKHWRRSFTASGLYRVSQWKI